MTVDDNSLDDESSPLLSSTKLKKRRFSETDIHLTLPTWKDENREGVINSKGSDSSSGYDVKVKGSRKRYLGILLGVVASVFLSLTTLFAKLLAAYHPFNEALWRFLGILLPSIPVLAYFKYGQGLVLTEEIWPLNERGKLRTFGVLFVSPK
jgi:hypothetical protein